MAAARATGFEFQNGSSETYSHVFHAEQSRDFWDAPEPDHGRVSRITNLGVRGDISFLFTILDFEQLVKLYLSIDIW